MYDSSAGNAMPPRCLRRLHFERCFSFLPPKNPIGEGIQVCKLIQSLLACSLNGSGGQVHTRCDLTPELLLKIVFSDNGLLPLVQKPDVMQKPFSLMTQLGIPAYVYSTPGMKQSAADAIGNTIRNAI